VEEGMVLLFYFPPSKKKGNTKTTKKKTGEHKTTTPPPPKKKKLKKMKIHSLSSLQQANPLRRLRPRLHPFLKGRGPQRRRGPSLDL